MKTLPFIAAATLLEIGASRASHTIGYQFEGATPLQNTETPGTFDGTFNGDASVGTPNTSAISSGSNSLLLDGTGDFVSITGGGSVLQNVGGFSITTFVNLNSLTATNSLVFFARNGGGGASARAVLQVLADGSLRVGGRRLDTDGFGSLATATGTIVAGTTYGVGATVDFNGGTTAPIVKLFINGSLVTQGTTFSTGATIANTVGDGGWVGAQGTGGEATNGRIDDVKIWNTAISDSAAKANTVPEPGSALLIGAAGILLLGTRRRKMA